MPHPPHLIPCTCAREVARSADSGWRPPPRAEIGYPPRPDVVLAGSASAFSVQAVAKLASVLSYSQPSSSKASMTSPFRSKVRPRAVQPWIWSVRNEWMVLSTAAVNQSPDASRSPAPPPPAMM